MADKKKIVIIDDEPDLCFVVKSNLEDAGEFEVVTSSNPKEAEDVLRREKPDVLLLDVVMPERSGQDVVASLQKDNDLKGIPVIMVSGKGEMVFDKRKNEFKWQPNNPLAKNRGDLPEAKGAEALAEAYGVADYVSKPFNTDVLVQVINEVLERFTKKKPSDDDMAEM